MNTYLHLLDEETEPRFHGNGFIQLYLNKRTRLHIWTPELPPIRNHNATIHTHRYDMASEVLEGVLKHTTYRIRRAHPGRAISEPATCRIVNLTGASDAEGRKELGVMDTSLYRHNIHHEYWLAAGSKYTFKGELFHTSDNGHDKLTATMFRKIGEDTPDFAQILVELGAGQPTHAFDPKTQPSQVTMRKIIHSVVMTHGRRIAEIISA